ncbi:MAG: hypothetical protein AAF824_01120 [Bacteroidota bacterium]
MKTIYTFLIPFVLITAVSCTDNDSDTPSAAGMATEEAAEIVGTSLASSSAGLTGMTSEVAETSNESATSSQNSVSEFTQDSTLSWTNQTGSPISFNAQVAYTYETSCDQFNLPEAFAYELTYSSSFDGPRMASSNSGGSSWTLSKLNNFYTSFELNGTYTRSGTWESKIFNKSTTSASATFTLDGLILDLPSESITGGTATYTLTGIGPQGSPYSFEGSIVFIDQGKATISIQGRTFMVDLESGEITEI